MELPAKISFTKHYTPELIFSIEDFFIGWQNKPDQTKFIKTLKNQNHKVLAIDNNNNTIIGFTYAITDNHLSAYIPLLEVTPAYQNKGIGKHLIQLLLNQLKHFYMIDLSCDADLISFYEKLNFIKSNAMLIRNYQAL